MDTQSRAYSQKLPGKELDVAIKKLQQMKAKGEVERSVMIEDDYIIEWRKKFLLQMEQ